MENIEILKEEKDIISVFFFVVLNIDVICWDGRFFISLIFGVLFGIEFIVSVEK